MPSPAVSRMGRPRTVRNTSIANANPTITSADATHDNPHTLSREWSVLETTLLEGQEHPLRRVNSAASLVQEDTRSSDDVFRRWSRAASCSGRQQDRDAFRVEGYFAQSAGPLPESVITREPLSAPVPIAADFGESDASDTEIESPSISELETHPPRFSFLPSLTTFQRDILKCSIAYFIGSLFTFNPYLSSLISDISTSVPCHPVHRSHNQPLSLVPVGVPQGPSPTGHMVATGTPRCRVVTDNFVL